MPTTPGPTQTLSHQDLGENAWLALLSCLSVHFVYPSQFQTPVWTCTYSTRGVVTPHFVLFPQVSEVFLNSKSLWQLQKTEKSHRTSTINRKRAERNRGNRIIFPEKVANFRGWLDQ